MNKLRIIALIVSTLAGFTVTMTMTTDAFACPRGYVRCGPGCCPGH
jgi:hypothetical protein